ncbi:hypothetical protein [Amnibacterium endophyticum]|uniref:Uncharacterized protein n=1 Tax=Amnibacterium endophyticum TaxID=2109337 RepID=A0ABW4LGV6_9MICO
MSPYFVVSVALIVLALVALRLIGLFPVLAAARPLTRVDALVAYIGTLALVFHCVTMFFPDLGRAVPGGVALAPVINDLGVASAILYVLPAAVLLFGIRRLHPIAVAVNAVGLVAVGITMYDGGPVAVHTAAIAVEAIALAVTATAFVRTVTPVATAPAAPVTGG